MNEYEAKQEDRKQRYLDLAAKAEAESERRTRRAMTMAGAMNGQPILIGHHSEKRHRRDIRRMDDDMRKGSEEHKKAKHYRDRAAGVGHAGISSDDPDACEKIRAQIAAGDAKRDLGKKLNAAWRRAGRPREAADWQAKFQPVLLESFGISAEGSERMRASFQSYEANPIPAYVFSNWNGNRKRYLERLAELERKDEEPEPEPVEGDGWRAEVSDSRVRVYFDAKPEESVRTMLKRHGFRWAPTVGAWQRQDTGNGRYACQQVVRALNARAA